MKNFISAFVFAVGSFTSLHAETDCDSAIRLSGELKQRHDFTLSLNHLAPPALWIKHAMVLGHILPGIPVWEFGLGTSSQARPSLLFQEM
jgi:hypothetical protein